MTWQWCFSARKLRIKFDQLHSWESLGRCSILFGRINQPLARPPGRTGLRLLPHWALPAIATPAAAAPPTITATTVAATTAATVTATAATTPVTTKTTTATPTGTSAPATKARERMGGGGAGRFSRSKIHSRTILSSGASQSTLQETCQAPLQLRHAGCRYQ